MQQELTNAHLEAIEEKTQSIGREIFAALEDGRSRPWERSWWDEQMLEIAMRDERLKVELFRFIDVLPTLRNEKAIVGHLQEYLADVAPQIPSVVRWALPMAGVSSLGAKALARATRIGAQSQARRFIAGENVDEVLSVARRYRKKPWAFTLDILGEAVASQREADRYHQSYLDLIEGIAPTVNSWPEVPQIDVGADGPLPRTNISVKLTSLDSQFDEIDPEGTIRRVAPRLREILRRARSHDAFINIDMESYHVKDLTLRLFKEVLAEPEFGDWPDVGIVIQAYLRDSERDLVELADWAARREAPIWVRLVKGAYWDYETIHAKSTGWPVPVFEQKWETDANFEQLARILLQHYEVLRPAIASHNVRSLAYSLALAEHLELPTGGPEVQMLYGMGDAEKSAIVDLGYRLRVYMPYGELIPGMAYLVRRLLENTANDSFLRSAFTEHVSKEELLAKPSELNGKPSASADLEPATEDVERDQERDNDMPAPYWKTFQNEPPSDFSKEENREKMQEALGQVESQFGGHSPLVIGGKPVETAERIESFCPSHKQKIVGTSASAGNEEAGCAVGAASGALSAWSRLSAEARADYIRNVAQQMRERRFELAAWIVHESAKPWREADADVCEAIDFCEFYSAGAIALESPSGKDVPGEENEFLYCPRGVTAVISPWNFPLAILTGMTTAALATGNTVVMKPAEQSPVVAAKLMEMFQAANLPPGVLNYLPGKGETAGAALVEHPDVSLIVFTGSRQVGLSINATAAQVSASGKTRGVKKVIAEMGGKNAIIVDDDADLDEAVLGVVKSAFGYQGQKCSACSRAIVVEGAYETFLNRLIEASRSLQVGPAEDPGTTVGPLIDEASREKVLEYIAIGRSEAREVLSVDVGDLADEGYFVGPHIFAEVSPDARIAQEEIFGPVLGVISVPDFDAALRVANDTDYALTGGVYSRSPAHLDQASREFLVGNLYLNRTCTGALVSRQPFGGFKFSGIGSKAGSPDYLLQFVIPRTVTENTIRRGFAPVEE